MMKNKTTAVWLTLTLGPLGLHKMYLEKYNWAAKLTLLPTLLGLYGVTRMQKLGVDDQISWLCIPLLGFMVSGFAMRALLYGLMDTSRWNARFNPDTPDSKAGASNGFTVLGLIVALSVGSTALMATLAFSFQHIFAFHP